MKFAITGEISDSNVEQIRSCIPHSALQFSRQTLRFICYSFENQIRRQKLKGWQAPLRPWLGIGCRNLSREHNSQFCGDLS